MKTENTGPPCAPLIEREAHLQLIRVVLDHVRAGDGQLLVVEGAAGAGKTALLRAAHDAALDTSMHVLSATAEELETTHVLGVVHQLLDQRVRTASGDQLNRLFAGPAQLVRSALYGDGDETAADNLAGALQSGALHHGLYWLLCHIADEAPLLITVDDLHWADAASLSFMAYLGRRLAESPIGVIVGTRPNVENATAPLRQRIRSIDSAHHLSPPPLSAGAVAQLVRSRVPEADDEACEAAFRASAGNPFLAEIAARMIRDGADSTTIMTAPDQLLGTVGRRLAELDPEPQQLAKALAVLAMDRGLAITAAVADMALSRALNAAEILARGEWIEEWMHQVRVQPDDVVLRFRHPLVRRAVIQLCSAPELDELHARAIDALRDARAEPDEIVVHALASLPRGSSATVDVLIAASNRASRSGAFEEALALLRRAVAEPPPNSDLPRVLDLMTRAATDSQAVDRDQIFERAIDAAPDAAARNRIRLRWARLLIGQQQAAAAHQVLAAALADETPDDPILHTEVTCTRLVALRADPDKRHEWSLQLDALSGDDLDPRSWAARGVLIERAFRNGILGTDRTEAKRFLDQATSAADTHELSFRQPFAFSTAMQCFVMVNEYAAGIALAERALAGAQSAGYAPTFRFVSAYLGVLYFRASRPRDAIAAAISDATTYRHFGVLVPLNAASTATGYLQLGQLDDADAVLHPPDGWGRYERELTFVGVPEVLGWLRLTQGRPAEAAELFTGIGEVLETLGGARPSTNTWRSGAARALHATGERKQAQQLSDEEVAMAREWGAPRQLGWALTTAGIVATGSQAIAHLDEAVAVLGGAHDPEPFLLGWAYYERGLKRRTARQRVDARDDLRRALDIGERHRFGQLALEANEALLEAGGRPRVRVLSGLDALTPAELRVARAATTGQSNAEIAADLFISRKAVEYHLSNAYRKLGIQGRAGLGDALREDVTQD